MKTKSCPERVDVISRRRRLGEAVSTFSKNNLMKRGLIDEDTFKAPVRPSERGVPES